MDNANGTIGRESLVLQNWRRWCLFYLQAAWFKEFLLVNMIKQEQFCVSPRMELCGGKSWTRQTLSNACESTNWEGLCGTPWQMVALELKLTKTVTYNKEGHGPPLPRILVESIPQVEAGRFYVLSAEIGAHGHTGRCRGCAALASHGRATKPHNNECRERSRTMIERTLTGGAWMNAHKDSVVETERVKERKTAGVERGAGMCLWSPGARSRWLIDMRSHLGTEWKTSTLVRKDRRQHMKHTEEDCTIRAGSSQFIVIFTPCMCLWNILRVVREDRAEPVFVQNSGHVDDDMQISVLFEFFEVDGRKSPYIKEVFDWYREEDAGDLRWNTLTA